MSIRHTAAIILSVLFISNAYGDKAGWINYTFDNRVNCIAPDGDFIWVATDCGLVRVDKKDSTSKYFNKANSGLPSNRIKSIAIDSEGNKWIGTESDGLVKYDDTCWTVYNSKNSGLPDINIYNMKLDNAGNKWINTCPITIDSAGRKWLYSFISNVVKFDGKKCSVFNYKNADNLNSLGDMEIESNGYLWFLGEKHLVCFNGRDFIKYDMPDTGEMSALAIDKEGIKWLGSEKGLWKFDGKEFALCEDKRLFDGSREISSIAIDHSGNKWIGTNRGLLKFDDSKYTECHDGESSGNSYNMQYDGINVLAIDNADIKWIGFNGCYLGSYNDTLRNYNDTLWKRYSISNMNLFMSLNVLKTDREGNMLIGGSFELIKYNGIEFEKWELQSYIRKSNCHVQDIYIDPSGTKFLGTDDGLIIIDTSGWKLYDTSRSGIADNDIYTINKGADSVLWIGTRHGLSKFDGNIWTTFDTSNSGLPGNIINSILIDSTGNKWIGTNNGLAEFDGVKWTLYDTLNSILKQKYPDIRSLAIDYEGNKWIGTGYGLVKYGADGWTIYSKSNSGLPSDNVSLIFIDNRNVKWICTDKGLARFNSTGWTVYNSENSGLESNQIESIAADSLGNIWICNPGMLAVYKESGLNKQKPVPLQFRKSPHMSGSITKISYSVTADGPISLRIISMSGRTVRTLMKNVQRNPGVYSIVWDGRDACGAVLANGMYICQLVTSGGAYSKVMSFVK